MRKNEITRLVLHELKKQFYSGKHPYIDWMGYPITDKNKPSYHHIKKAEILRSQNKSDEPTKENGAYLGKTSHEMLHKIEILDKELYDSWTYLFEVINNMGIYPIEDIWKMIDLLQIKTEKVIRKKCKRGKI